VEIDVEFDIITSVRGWVRDWIWNYCRLIKSG
jgi:hypothetical protein